MYIILETKNVSGNKTEIGKLVSLFFLKNKVEIEILHQNLTIHISQMLFFVILFYP